jgi:hypothetical protein
MAVIYLQHPVHGTKVATMDMEANYDEMHGWMRYDPESADEDVTEDINEMAPRRGRPRKVETQEG